MIYYTGVGARKTPPHVLKVMTKLAARLSDLGLTLRSGGAQGADTAFEHGAIAKDIYTAKDTTEQAMEIASQYHPAWHRCSDYAKRLHARNVFQVIGADLATPSKFLICWTEGGKTVGGTATAIRIADAYSVPVFNLGRGKVAVDELGMFIKSESYFK